MDTAEIWPICSAIRTLVDAGKHDIALIEIAKYRDQCAQIGFSPLFVLEADCIARGGKHEDYVKAVDILEKAAGYDPENFWIFNNLGQYLRCLGRDREALTAMWNSHRLVGWPESGEKGYEFTHDYFFGNIPRWQGWFAEVVTMRPIYCLEVGSWQGESAAWLLDKVISARGGLLTCIDTFTGSSEHQGIVGRLGSSLEEIFDENIGKSGYGGIVRKLVGLSQECLRPLPASSLDFIYIDGAHEAKFVIQDAILAWPLLRPHGFMLFDDLPARFPDNPRQDTARAIEFFLEVFGDELKCLHKEWQVLLQKGG